MAQESGYIKNWLERKMKQIKHLLLDMIRDTSGHINSKIVMGILSFVIATILAIIKLDNLVVGMFLSYSAGSFGWTCFDNNSAFKFQKVETTTNSKTTNLDIAETVRAVKGNQ